MFKLKTTRGLGEIVSNVFMTPIVYEDRLQGRKWSDSFGKYENQKWGLWDSNSCWCLSAVNSAEDQLELLNTDGKFSPEAMDFFTKNGYIDSDGDFSLSERYLEILSGHGDNGANQMDAWVLMQKYGCIPRSMLTYTQERASQWSSKSTFNTDYFDTNAITSDMLALGQQFLKYVNISRQWIGKNWYTPDKELLRAALKQAPLCIGVPVPQEVYKWNSTFVQYDGGKSAQHAIELYDIDAQGNYMIFDQYLENLKVLSSDYFLPIVTQGILMATPTEIPVISHSYIEDFWQGVIHWYNGIFDSKTHIGMI